MLENNVIIKKKKDNRNNSSLKELLNSYWLRPETALWRSIDINIMSDFEFISPSLDIGCGDAIFSFIRAGGKLDIQFDAFSSLKNIDKFFENVDVYDSFQNIDNVDIIAKESKYKIDVAFDHKKNLLKKAALLNIHKKFVVGDANQRLPFENETFVSIFSNIIYWLDNPENVFKEIHRILKKKGKCSVMLPNKSFIDYSFYNTYFVKTKNEKFQIFGKIRQRSPCQ